MTTLPAPRYLEKHAARAWHRLATPHVRSGKRDRARYWELAPHTVRPHNIAQRRAGPAHAIARLFMPYSEIAHAQA